MTWLWIRTLAQGMFVVMVVDIVDIIVVVVVVLFPWFLLLCSVAKASK